MVPIYIPISSKTENKMSQNIKNNFQEENSSEAQN